MEKMPETPILCGFFSIITFGISLNHNAWVTLFKSTFLLNRKALD